MNPASPIANKVPFLKYTVLFGAGLCIGHNLHWQLHLIAMIAILPILFISSRYFKKNKQAQTLVKSLTLLSSILIIGMLYGSYSQANRFGEPLNEYNKYYGYILSEKPGNNQRTQLSVQLFGQQDSSAIEPIDEKVLLNVPDSIVKNKIKAGQIIHFSTKFYPFNTLNNPGEFNYSDYMLLNGYRYQAYPKILELTPNERHTLRTLACRIQAKLHSMYETAGLSGEELAVVSALSLGNKNLLTPEIKAEFSKTGAMHVLAVSGLHVGIIYLILSFMFKPIQHILRLTVYRVTLIILLLWAYAFITGLAPSVMRATVMFSLIIIGQNLQRKTSIYNTLCVSAFLLMLIEPIIIYQLGFQLSYAAVASIVYFQPKINALIQIKWQPLSMLWTLLSVAIAAQIGTFPITIYYFHQFPVYFWLSNFIAIPAATVLLYLAFVFFITFPVSIIAKSIIWLVKAVALAFNWGIKSIDALPGAVITNIQLDTVSMIILMLLVLMIAWLMAYKNIKTLQHLLIVTIVLLAYTSVKMSLKNQQSIVVFYNTYSNPMVSLIDGRDHYFYTKNDTLDAFTNSLLDNSSHYFGTNKPIKLGEETNSKACRKYEQHLYFKDICIAVNDTESKTFSHDPDIIWQTTNAKVIINEHSNLSLSAFKNGKKFNLNFAENTEGYKLQNNSSLLIFLTTK